MKRHFVISDPVGEIIANLTVARSKVKVVSKILELGLVSDKKELRKKRRKGKQDGKRKRKPKKSSDDESGNESADHVTDKDDSYSSEDNNLRDLAEGSCCLNRLGFCLSCEFFKLQVLLKVDITFV